MATLMIMGGALLTKCLRVSQAEEPRRSKILPSLMAVALTYVVLMSFVFVIGPTERAVLASYTILVPALLHDQCTGANSQSELVILNGL